MGVAPTHAQPADWMKAPNVELRGTKGQRVRIADFRGKIVIVEFWASWCPDCHISFPALDAIHREFKARGVEVIAINVDEHRKDADAFLKGRQPQLHVMFDPRGRAWDAFLASGVPTSYVIDRSGVIRHTYEGFDKDTDAAYRREIAALLAEP
jgi:cytochrome c biogenesis protein CcmG, thiol:disulfide interchange protein DsbE